MNRVFEIEFQSLRHSLKSTPERFSGVLYNVVRREGSQQLFDLVVEDILENLYCKFDTSLVALFLIRLVQSVQVFQFNPKGSRVLPVLFLELF